MSCLYKDYVDQLDYYRNLPTQTHGFPTWQLVLEEVIYDIQDLREENKNLKERVAQLEKVVSLMDNDWK